MKWFGKKAAQGSARPALARGFGTAFGSGEWPRSYEAQVRDAYPVVEAEDMPDIATDSFSIAFGNFRAGYLIAERSETSILRDPFNQGRQNAAYADVDIAAGVQKTMSEKFDLLHQRNVKTDTFTTNTTVTGRTGDWRVRYGVGNLGNVVVTGDATSGLGAAADPSGGNWSGEYLEPGSTWAAGEANVTFTDNKAGSAGAGGGTYSLTGVANAAYARVPAGRGVLRYDLAGALRMQDGTGAAGAYERTG